MSQIQEPATVTCLCSKPITITLKQLVKLAVKFCAAQLCFSKLILNFLQKNKVFPAIKYTARVTLPSATANLKDFH